jgi:hypothetical protein
VYVQGSHGHHLLYVDLGRNVANFFGEIMSEERLESVAQSDDDTLQPKDELSSPVIGERFVPPYMLFDDWGARRRDDFFEYRFGTGKSF